jgi:hypothetical protein
MGVFGLLAGSIGAGIYRLATDPWSEEPIKNNSRNEKDHGGNPPVFEGTQDLNDTKKSVEDGPPNINEGITDIQFGDPK